MTCDSNKECASAHGVAYHEVAPGPRKTHFEYLHVLVRQVSQSPIFGNAKVEATITAWMESCRTVDEKG